MSLLGGIVKRFSDQAKPLDEAIPNAFGVDTTGGQKKGTLTQEQLDQTNALVDPTSPTYMGPGYQLSYDGNGDPVVSKKKGPNGVLDPTAQMAQTAWEEQRSKEANGTAGAGTVTGDNQSGFDPNQYLNAAMDRFQTPVTNPALTGAQKTDRIAQALQGTQSPAPTAGGFIRTGPQQRAAGAPPPGNPAAAFTPNAGVANDLKAANDKLTNGGVAPGQPGSEAPTVNREKIDNILGGLDTYQNKIADLAEDNTGLSVAEAQLKKATDLANLQAGIDTEASQRAALGAARSARSRGDRALLERQAVGESAFIGQEAARTAALKRAQNEGDLAQLRAQEADYDRRFRLEALGKAADLGLNRSALEVDISKTNLDSATNWINQQFNQLGIDKQLNQEQAQALLGFTRDMAAIEEQYDALSQQDKEATNQLLMQKYGIDQQTLTAMNQMKEQQKFHWGAALQQFIGGAGAAATQAGAKAAGIG